MRLGRCYLQSNTIISQLVKEGLGSPLETYCIVMKQTFLLITLLRDICLHLI